jgi:hypothetical protein
MTWEPTIFREDMVGSERQPNTYEGFCGVVNENGRFDYNDVIIWDETNQNGDIAGYLPNNCGLPKTGTSHKWQFEWGKE